MQACNELFGNDITSLEGLQYLPGTVTSWIHEYRSNFRINWCKLTAVDSTRVCLVSRA